MSLLEQESAQTLRSHPSIAKVATEVATVQLSCYGREWAPLDCGTYKIHVAFEDRAARRAEMQCRLRCAGLDFELQLVEPAALLDIGAALAPGVPINLQRAAVLFAANELLQALERRLGARIELTGLSGTAPTWDRLQALGLNISRRGSDDDEGRPRRSAAFLRALQREGWQLIARAAREMALSTPAHDAQLDLTLYAESVSLTVAELRQMEPGDVLLLDAPATQLDAPEVVIRLGRQLLPDLRASLSPSKLRVTHAPDRSKSTIPTADTPTPRRHPPWSTSMNSLGTDSNSHAARSDDAPHPLDSIQVDIELELGRLSLPLSALRSIAVGQVFETEQSVDSDGIVLWCGGQRIGLGRLVTVGDRLAVRVAALQTTADTGSPIPRSSA